ncbi:hypothetical protein WJX72_001052 [[Myrmecia] bisecta]|uniref:GTPase Der n=1 Tax=[Myrmecia] bisecta TaxID=41462 RepID=A0AAW1QNV9_9CHLO
MAACYVASPDAPATTADTRDPSAAEQAELDRIAQAMAAKLQDAYLAMPPDAVEERGSAIWNDADEGLDWDSSGVADADSQEPAPSRSASKAGKKGQQSGRSRQQQPKEKQVAFDDLPKVAIVGRPNVGKSALFNRLTGSSLAIVYDFPGVTRDRLYTRAVWGNQEFVIVDTGGLMSDAAKLSADVQQQAMQSISAAGLPEAIERQAAAGVAEADSIILVVDGQAGLTASDEEIVSWLRKKHPGKPVTLAVNKCENPAKADVQAAEFWNTGLEPWPISAISGTGTGELLDNLAATLPPPRSEPVQPADADPLAIAIIGRPNVGKSSLLNALVGTERSIVSSMSGTTRDAIDTDISLPDGRKFTLIDTAGVRKRVAVAASKDGAEPLSVGRAFTAIRRAEVVLLVIDAAECANGDRFTITQQDFRLAETIAAEGRACVILVNKWDAVPNKDSNLLTTFQKDILAQLRPISWAKVVFTSATTGQRVQRILDAAWDAGEEHRRRVSTATLNMVLKETVNWRSPPTDRGSGKRGRMYYATQAATRPPTFVFFVNETKLFTDDYRRYVERQLRDNVGFPGTPVRVFWRGKPPRLDGRPGVERS